MTQNYLWEAVPAGTLGGTGWQVRPVHRDGGGYGAFAFNLTEQQARTVAAAPAMLAALREAEIWLCDIMGDCVRDATPGELAVLHRIESAIAAATGNPIPSAPTVGD